MADIDTLASPRSHKRHQRYANFSRLNHSKQELSFLTQQATRLGTTPANIFHLLDSFTAGQIKGAASLGAL